MQMVRKILLVLVVLLFSLVLFAPKRELYYLLEKQLMKQDIIINNAQIQSGLFTLTLKGLQIYVKGIEVARVDEVEIFSLLVYNRLSATGIETESSLYRLIPTKVESMDLEYQILKPTAIQIDTNGTFGRASGFVDASKIHLNLAEEGSIAALKPMLRSGNEGWYYELSF